MIGGVGWGGHGGPGLLGPAVDVAAACVSVSPHFLEAMFVSVPPPSDRESSLRLGPRSVSQECYFQTPKTGFGPFLKTSLWFL